MTCKSLVVFFHPNEIKQMAEEVENAAIALPQALLLTLMINGLLGIGILVVLLYCIDNLESAMNATGYSPVQFFFLATGSTSGTISMTCLCVVMNVVACFGVLPPTSRQIWSLARDRGIPGWTFWRRVCMLLLRLQVFTYNNQRFHHVGYLLTPYTSL